ncbi:MAG: GntR family transcriptional regulator, partial [Gemmatimonadales bacterium]|nr:GntR family transcriptional regulator [Gemmatimonadales bacterium]
PPPPPPPPPTPPPTPDSRLHLLPHLTQPYIVYKMPTATAQLPRRTLTEAATAVLRDRILGGALAMGTPLRQEALAAELGVSRIPLREALLRLEAEGLVTMEPHRGAVVASVRLDEVAELFELRAVLESDLTRRAVPRLSPDDDRALAAAAAGFERAVEGGAAAWGDANRTLHLALYRPAERPCTLDVVTRLHAQCDRLLRLQLTLTKGIARAVREHRAIVSAARARDAEGTARLVEQHILEAGRTLTDALAHHHTAGKS